MRKIQLTLACDTYDRTAALADGTVQPEGIDLNYIHLPVEETFWRMCQYHEFDISEMSLSSYMINLSRNDDFRAIPVFPSRAFRHDCIFINADSGIGNLKTWWESVLVCQNTRLRLRCFSADYYSMNT